jgi:uncharacterized protein YkwD
MRALRWVSIVGVMLAVVLTSLYTIVYSAPPQPNPEEAQRALVALNQWRQERGYWLLRPNPTLERMAQAQAEYILSLPQIPAGGDIHRGAQGESVRERAVFSAYNWTYYGRPEQVAVTEIAYIGASVAKAVDFWQGSDTHRRSVENGRYREVGIAALPHTFGHFYVVVLGSRPNVLPTLYDPLTRTLHLSNETFPSTAGDWIENAEQVRLFDAEGRPLHAGWLPWADSMPVPDNAGGKLFVAYADARGNEALSEVELADVASSAPPLAAPPQPTPTPSPTATSPAPVPVNNPGIIPTLTPIKPTDLPPSATPVPTAAPNLLLLYHSRSMVLVNLSRNPLDISDLVLTDGTNRLPVTAWNTPYLSGSLEALPAGDCVQGWSFSEASMLNQPSNCRYRRSVINLSGNQLFWTRADFQLLNGMNIVGQCTAAAARCEVILPQ